MLEAHGQAFAREGRLSPPAPLPRLRIRYAGDGSRPEPVLAAVVYGTRALPAEPRAPLVVRVPLEPLGPEPALELWTGVEARAAREDGYELAESEEVLAGAVRLAGAALEREVHDAYRRMLAIVSARGMHLVRIWNVLPRINAREDGLERYKRFCVGRARAFEEHFGPGFESRLCACSAVGGEAEGVVLWFLATRRPGVHQENARQVSAYRYPRRYGPRSPSFARATLAPPELGGELYLSGTASIIGHASVHAGDVVAQTRETLLNLRVLLEAAGARLGGGRRRPAGLLKVYVRSAADREAVRRVLEAEIGAGVPALYLRADVCREELLVEIEGTAPRAGAQEA